MKKTILLALASCSLLTMTACSKKDPEPTQLPLEVETEVNNDSTNLPAPYPMAQETEGDLPLSEEEERHQSVAQRYPNIDMDNVILDSNKDDILTLMNEGSGVVYFASPQDAWSQFLIYEVDLTCKAAGTDVKLYDLTSDFDANDPFINEIAAYLNLKEDEMVKQPLVMFVEDGELVGYYTPDVDMNSTSPQDYYDADKTIEVEDKLYSYAMEVAS